MARITPKETILPPPSQYTPAMYRRENTICVRHSEDSHTALETYMAFIHASRQASASRFMMEQLTS